MHKHFSNFVEVLNRKPEYKLKSFINYFFFFLNFENWGERNEKKWNFPSEVCEGRGGGIFLYEANS